MKISLVEPYMAGSHAAWAREFRQHSRHDIDIVGLEGRHWKWRMHGGAVTLARRFLSGTFRPDLILATDMLDLTTFLALTRKLTADIPVALYMHENQLSYPWSPADSDPSYARDAHYCFINYASALAADKVLFNSDFHRNDFLARLSGFLRSFPDHNETASIDLVAAKCETLSLGLDLGKFDPCRPQATAADRPPLVLWNHRWEYDKNPDDFFKGLFQLQDNGIEFELAVLGESYRTQPPVFAEARQRLGRRILHWGFAENFAEYAAWLWKADILPVTSIHDFFGVSVVEAIYCGCIPLLPRRLAYPEHVPSEYHQDFYYSDPADFVRRLAGLCRTGTGRRTGKLSDFVRRYDWSTIGATYDQTFENMVPDRLNRNLSSLS